MLIGLNGDSPEPDIRVESLECPPGYSMWNGSSGASCENASGARIQPTNVVTYKSGNGSSVKQVLGWAAAGAGLILLVALIAAPDRSRKA